MLGMACLIFGIVLSWRLLQEMSAPRSYQSDRTFLVHGVVLAMLIALLAICNSMTALGCFIMASGLILAMTFPGFARRRALVHFMVVAIVCTVIVTLFVDIGGLLLQQLGRNPTLTGRTELWADLPAFGASPLFGTGFESFWLGPRLDKIWALHWWRPNQAHNGYLEAYLNLGAVGVGLLALVAIRGYRRISAMIGYDPVGAQLRLAFFVVAVAYNFTEAAFRAQHPVWLTFLIAIIAVPRPQPHGAAERGDTKASAKRRPALAGAYRRQGRSKPLQRPSAT
jgi:O-antigen ligase